MIAALRLMGMGGGYARAIDSRYFPYSPIVPP